jgi:hypothetical protein
MPTSMASPVHDDYTKIELLVDPTSDSTCELEKNEELFLTQPEGQELEPLLVSWLSKLKDLC